MLVPVRCAVTVPLRAERAFALFTEGVGRWWPREYTWSGETLDTIAIEPRTGGRCFERGPHGFICDWGRVLVSEPPRRLVFTWQIAPDRVPQPDPDRAGEVEVAFVADGPGRTHVEVEHRGFERHGEGAVAYRDGMASPDGWRFMLERYAKVAAVERAPEGPGAR